jgi:hypothetical protein
MLELGADLDLDLNLDLDLEVDLDLDRESDPEDFREPDREDLDSEESESLMVGDPEPLDLEPELDLSLQDGSSPLFLGLPHLRPDPRLGSFCLLSGLRPPPIFRVRFLFSLPLFLSGECEWRTLGSWLGLLNDRVSSSHHCTMRWGQGGAIAVMYVRGVRIYAHRYFSLVNYLFSVLLCRSNPGLRHLRKLFVSVLFFVSE